MTWRLEIGTGRGGTKISRRSRGLLAIAPLALLLWNAPAASGAWSFSPHATYPAGTRPLSVATDDFDQDGNRDVAVTNLINDFPSDTVSVLLGEAGGGFAAPVAHSIGRGLQLPVATDDFNGDGDPDLVVANDGARSFSVLLGGAGGSFGAQTVHPAVEGPSSLAIDDFNGDGDPDLVVGNEGASTVSVFLGGAGGGFGAETGYPVIDGPNAVATGDFNGDSDPDLAVATEGHPDAVQILPGAAGGGFGPPATFSLGGDSVDPTAVATGDFNGDSDPDLAVTSAIPGSDSPGAVIVFLGEAGAGFGSRTSYPVGGLPLSVAVGDLDDDGRPDLVTANSAANTVSLLPGQAGGSFGTRTDLPVGSRPTSVAIADFAGDDNPDLAVTNYSGNTVSVLLNTTSAVGFDPGSVAFPPTPAGSETGPRTVTLQNNGPNALSVSGVTVSGADAAGFATGDDTCTGAVLPTGDSCSVAVRFRPPHLGSHSARLEFTDDASGSPHSLPLAGTGTPPATVSPSSIAWQPRPDSTQSTYRTVTLTNLGSVDLTVSGVALTGTNPGSFRAPSEYDGCTGETLAASGSCNVLVRFRPDGTGPMSANLDFSHSAPGGPQRVTMTGTGLPGPWLSTSLQGLKFGHVDVGSQSQDRTLTITNTGSAPLEVTGISVQGANPGDFPGLTETCTGLASLGPDQSCAAELAFRPTGPGIRAARLVIAHTAPRGIYVATLRGFGR